MVFGIVGTKRRKEEEKLGVTYIFCTVIFFSFSSPGSNSQPNQTSRSGSGQVVFVFTEISEKQSGERIQVSEIV